MTRYYVSHYFDFKNIGIFMLVSLIGLVAVLAVVLITAKLQMRRRLNYDRLNERDVAELSRSHRIREIGMIESFFEMTFSSTSVLLFLSLYYIIDARIPQAFFLLEQISGCDPAAFFDSVRIFHRMAGSLFCIS